MSAASADEIRAQDYALRPHATTQEILNNVPGVVVAQHQGGGKATQYLVRGFDADHGTDFAVFVDELPVNLVSHAHGQGYADLNFVIPETVERLQVYKGPYFAQFGDFSSAGALNVMTRDEVEENFALAEGGSFETHRYVVVASPPLRGARSLVAAQALFSNGPFDDPQRYARYNVFHKLTLEPDRDRRLTISSDVYAGDWDGSGQIPLRCVGEAGCFADPARELDRFGSIDPTEGGSTDRENVNIRYSYRPTIADSLFLQAYGTRYKLRLFSNFTFYKETGLRFVREADGRVCDTARTSCSSRDFLPGDGIEQNDQREMYGARARYGRDWNLAGLGMETQLGAETRHDAINLGLHRQVRRKRFFSVNKLRVEERSIGTFLHHQMFPADWIRIEFGLRGDVFFFDTEDRLPAQAEDPNFEAVRIAGDTVDSIVSPKANLILTPLDETDFYFNFGTGFHSNDARHAILAKSEPEKAGGLKSPLTRSLGFEIGARTRQFNRLDVAAAFWFLDLDSELVFSGDAGNQETGASGSFEPAGATRRWGIDFEMRSRLTDWLFADIDLGYADPRLRHSGEAIPLAPTLLLNGGLRAEFDNGFSASLRLRHLGDRPAIEDRSLTAEGYTLVDLLARYRWRNLEASVALLNLTDADWREAQFADTSCSRGEIGSASAPNCLAAPGKQGSHDDPEPDIHFTPGNPFGVRAGLTMYF